MMNPVGKARMRGVAGWLGAACLALVGDTRLLAQEAKPRATLIERHTIYSLAFSPDGKMLASGSKDRTSKLWDVATGKKTVALLGHAGAVLSVAFSPDGKTLASGG